jgi:hypothetical protein
LVARSSTFISVTKGSVSVSEKYSGKAARRNAQRHWRIATRFQRKLILHLW